MRVCGRVWKVKFSQAGSLEKLGKRLGFDLVWAKGGLGFGLGTWFSSQKRFAGVIQTGAQSLKGAPLKKGGGF